jgi:flavin reductase (DIM6/NTAB) family NADH-FMN oxidoreductase RutF
MEDFMFKEIKPEKMSENVFELIGQKWMLITAGDKEKYNTMTASWGGLGVLWSKNVAFCFIRPQRYTKEFVENNDIFTLSFYSECYRDALNLCGSKSGRDIDKAKATGLIPAYSDGGVYFEQADIVLVCKKIYFQDFNPAHFLDADIEKTYAKKDYHRMYVGDIKKILIKE